jgi:hypothetical protein
MLTVPRCHFGAVADADAAVPELELLEEEEDEAAAAVGDTTRYSTRVPSGKRGGGGDGEACRCLCDACNDDDEDDEEDEEEEDAADAIVRSACGRWSSSLSSDGDVDEHRSITGATMRGGETRPSPAAAAAVEEPDAAVVNLEAGSCGVGVGGAPRPAEFEEVLELAAVGDDMRAKKSVTAGCDFGDCAAMLLTVSRVRDSENEKLAEMKASAVSSWNEMHASDTSRNCARKNPRQPPRRRRHAAFRAIARQPGVGLRSSCCTACTRVNRRKKTALQAAGRGNCSKKPRANFEAYITTKCTDSIQQKKIRRKSIHVCETD